jgi:hypothetical protein
MLELPHPPGQPALRLPHGTAHERPRERGLDLLKWLALACMVVDHLRFLLPGQPLAVWGFVPGRLAFPLFCLALAANLARRPAGGFAGAERRHLGGLLLFAALSEPAHDLLLGNAHKLNILASLALGWGLAWGLHARRHAPLLLAALLALTAIRNQDKIGLILFSDHIVKSIPPRKGRTAVMRLVREILAAGETRDGTDIAAALRFLSNVQKRRAVVFLISDFQAQGYERPLRVVARRHDLIACPISDPREFALPDVGILELQDPETGALHLVDTRSRRVRAAFAARAAAERDALQALFLRCGLDTLCVSTDPAQPYINDVRRLFRRRQARAGRRL